MLALTARQKAAIREQGTMVAVFVHMGHPDGDIYVWSGTGVVDHDGQQWVGCGHIGSITGVEGSSDPRVSRVNFVLSAVPGDALNLSNANLKDRTAIIYHAIMRPGCEIVDGLIQRDLVDLDTQEVSGSDDGTFVVAVNGQSGFWQLESAPRLFWSPEQQKIDFPGDTGMDALAALEDRIVTWTAT